MLVSMIKPLYFMSNFPQKDIVLASASPRRLELLQQIGVDALVNPVPVEEILLVDEKPLDFVQRLAAEKAKLGFDMMSQQGIEWPVLGSDTIVEMDGEVFGKPTDSEHAVSMLSKLSGKVHNVHTAVSVRTAEAEYSALSSSQVEFAYLSKAVIEAYVATGEPLDKAGAYGIQGLAAQFVKHLHGSYSGVMGLPLYETADLLSKAGVKTLG